MSKLTEYMDNKLYPGFKGNWDDDHFREVIKKNIKSEFTCLDYGAGRGNIAQMNFKGQVQHMSGIDPDDAIFKNPYLDDAKVLNLETGIIPYDDNTFDLVFSDNVMEHIADTEQTFKEIWRVLKPGGRFISKTPNKWHYVPTLARLTPQSFHVFINKLRGRKEEDTFPTLYKCNTQSTVKKYAYKTGFKVGNIEVWEGRPEYLRIFAPLYFVGYLYERLVNSLNIFKGLRCVLVFNLSKPNK